MLKSAVNAANETEKEAAQNLRLVAKSDVGASASESSNSESTGLADGQSESNERWDSLNATDETSAQVPLYLVAPQLS